MPAEQAVTVDLSALDFTRTIVAIAKIEAANPHRHEMKLLSGVAHIDTEARIIVGYVDTSTSDFWVRGHFPKYPVMPGVLMCEAAAQLANYYTAHVHPSTDRLIGLGGIEEARFREMIRPGERLILVGHGLRVGLKATKFAVRGHVHRDGQFVNVFEATIIGVSLGKWEDLLRA